MACRCAPIAPTASQARRGPAVRCAARPIQLPAAAAPPSPPTHTGEAQVLGPRGERAHVQLPVVHVVQPHQHHLRASRQAGRQAGRQARARQVVSRPCSPRLPCGRNPRPSRLPAQAAAPAPMPVPVRAWLQGGRLSCCRARLACRTSTAASQKHRMDASRPRVGEGSLPPPSATRGRLVCTRCWVCAGPQAACSQRDARRWPPGAAV
jgi:hypothetical protein